MRRAQHLEMQHPVHPVSRVNSACRSPRRSPPVRHTGADGLAGSASSIASTPWIASSMARYPVQRQRFPFSARGRSLLLVGEGRRGHDHPAVQKPHWKPGASQERRCIGCRSSGVPSPSIVVTSRPSARNAGVMQL